MEYSVEILPDDHMGAPWVEHDGHGSVSDWTRRDKAPGELLLVDDRGDRRYYDFAEACRIALRDGWDSDPLNTGGRETPRQQAAKAARADYEYLRGWCEDRWCWVGVVVRPVGACHYCGESASLWGIKSSDTGYLDTVAEELKTELAART